MRPDRGRNLDAGPRGAGSIGDRAHQLGHLVASPGVPAVGVAEPVGRGGRYEARLLPESFAGRRAVTHVEAHAEARARGEGQHARIADVVEVQPVEFRVPRRQLREGLGEARRHARGGRIDPHGRGSHPVVASVRFGHVELRIVEDRSALLVDENRVAAEFAHERRIAVVRQGEDIEPGVNA